MKRERAGSRRIGFTCVALVAGAVVLAGVGPADGATEDGYKPTGGKRWAAVSDVVSPAAGAARFQLRVYNSTPFGAVVDHAVRAWSEGTGGAVDIRGVSDKETADVVFKATDACDRPTAQYLPVDGRGPRTDPIVLNTCVLRGSNTKRTMAAAAHEMGHALGIGHFNPPQGQLMDKVWQQKVTTPQRLDKEHFVVLWGSHPGDPRYRDEPGDGNWSATKASYVPGDFTGDGKDDVMAFYDYGNAQTKAWLFRSDGNALAPAVAWDSGG